MGNIQEYKCPCCGGAIHFDSTIQKMKCPYCDTEFEMEALQGYDEALNQEQPDEMVWDTSAGTEWSEGETNGLHTYQCQSCGGEIVGDESMAASACPYCGNPIVVTGQFSGALKPDYVIPFKLDKKAAKAGLMRHLRGKRLLPKVFKDQNHIDEIKGIYVPFWLFDTDADADIRYRATKVRSWSDKNYNYTETRFFMVARSGNIGFTRVPVDGSTKMEDDLMESIEPFDFKEAVPFQTAYLAGYMADKYDQEPDELTGRVYERMEQSVKDCFEASVKGYATVTPKQEKVTVTNKGEVKYGLFPVWFLNTKWNGKTYSFAMNGQTGKFVGNLPTDKGAYVRWFVGLTAGISVAAFSILSLLWML